MLKQIFSKSIDNITLAAALVATSSLLSRVLGVLRDRILAGAFGAGVALDNYYAAFRIPDLIFNLVVLGALSAGFIPVFTNLIKKRKEQKGKNNEAWRLVNNLLNSLLILLTLLSVAGIIFSDNLTRLITPGFELEQQQEVAALTRIMFLSPIFLGLSGIMGGVLQSFKRFLVYSLTPIFYNLGIIIGALYFVNIWGLAGLAWGVVLGSFLHFVIQLPTVYNLGFRYRAIISWRDKSIRKIAVMMVPRTMSLAISQINLVVITVIASSLESGSLTAFNFANNLQAFPVGIFGISFAIAAFPVLAENANNYQKLTSNFSKTMRRILFFVVPATVLIVALRAQIVRVVLGTGNFDWRSTFMTMDALGFFALSLFAQATIPLLTRMYYAKHNSKTPFYFGLISIAVNIILSVCFGKSMGVAGLALAFSIANIINFILLWAWLYVKVGALDFSRIILSFLKFSFAAVGAGLATQISKFLVWPLIDMTTFIGVFSQLLFSSLVGLLVYLLFCYLLESEELVHFITILKKRWPFKKIKVGDQGEARGIS
ncbi:MAG: murein biosynthesis integral membrane protein MurJ [Patescibacteria group bacterium]|nr:murein biosynthesis integral membrane protein MurJ [Patescibacteria group bacterium]MDD3939373.1 murein biosynthesis integral membrane protein MurJ [Patescibacteria group bacterium]MDD4443919.1 murein biosynthesis integral membrane protein MurJ [Patescibacteria group bacterium]NCU39872.1 murein biosynthesis integral membrane protein MurJ [Candidatus Falkowbacteria bacterium]